MPKKTVILQSSFMSYLIILVVEVVLGIVIEIVLVNVVVPSIIQNNSIKNN